MSTKNYDVKSDLSLSRDDRPYYCRTTLLLDGKEVYERITNKSGEGSWLALKDGSMIQTKGTCQYHLATGKAGAKSRVRKLMREYTENVLIPRERGYY